MNLTISVKVRLGQSSLGNKLLKIKQFELRNKLIFW